MAEIRTELWENWNNSEKFAQLRKAVLIFGGSTRTEVAINVFPDVFSTSTEEVKGFFYITSRRLVFLPSNTLSSQNMKHITYENLAGITASKADLSMTLVDTSNGTATFKFQTHQKQSICFHAIRVLAEASREPIEKFIRAVNEVSTKTDDTTFTSIEVELKECRQMHEVKSSLEEIQVSKVLAPAGSFFKYFTSTKFDIHLKLRILCCISFVSFVLKYIPFLPLVCILLASLIVYNAWTRTDIALEFYSEWINWGDPNKTYSVLVFLMFIIVSWIFLPTSIYVANCVIAGVFLFVYPRLIKHV